VLSVEAMFNFADLCRLKSIADLYVSPHRSEGFGLNIIESILLGVPVLCSDYAGGTDLLADNDPPLVPVALREIGRTMGPYAAAAVWAEPDIEAMQSRLLAYFKKPRSEKKFAEMRQRLAGLLSAASVGAGLKRQFEKFCAFGAESSQNRLEIFRAMAGLRHDECLRFDYVKELSRRSPDSPGLDRLGEITMAAVNPDFAIITPVLQLEQGDVETIFDDLISQSYPAWEWCIVADDSTAPALQAALRALRQRDARIKLRIGPGLATAAAAINAGAAISQAPYIIVAGAAGRLSINMLAHYCGHIREHAVTGIIYPDEDAAGGATFFKPDWSPELLLGGNYIGNGFCVRKAEFLKLGGYREAFDGAHDYDFLLRAAAAHLPVQHLDTILFHRRLNGAGAAADSRGQSALADYLKTIGIEAKVDPGLLPATYRPRPRLPASRVALNILTGAARRREPPGAGAALLEALPPELAGTYAAGFVASILAQPPDVDFEIRVVADQAVASLMAPLAALDQRVSIIPFARAGQTFNFAEMANFALAGAAADRLVLLNDDMEALDEDWLPALLEMLELPGAGIIGGQLLHDEGLVQHSGIVLGVHGATAHLFEGIGATDPGYNGYNLTIRNYAAVTGAMMALHRATLERAGGFDIEFPVDYNDVDFCLRVGELGLRTIYTPFARLRHFESRSARRLFVDGFDKQKFIGRWARVIEHDPYYNRNLTRHGVQCELKS
jgi:GT2 family glycosyltransferase